MSIHFFYVIHAIICVLLVLVILFQDGKTGGLVSVSDSSSQVFGARGASSFLTKLTSVIAVLFMASSLFLAFMSPPSDQSIASDFVPTQPPSSSAAAPAGDDGSTNTPIGDIQTVDEEGNVVNKGLSSDDIQDVEFVRPEDLPPELREEFGDAPNTIEEGAQNPEQNTEGGGGDSSSGGGDQ
jgi:preprotein translocase subunit SecG